MKYYVYRLIDPRDGSTFYVGKGCGDRMYQHVKEARNGRQSRKCDRIREIFGASMEIGYEIDSRHKDELEAYEREAQLIGEIGLHRLTNLNRGGGGVRKGMPRTNSYSSWMLARRAMRGLSIYIRQMRAGYKLMLGGVCMNDLCRFAMDNMVKEFGFGRVADEMRRNHVELVHGRSST
jgi:hypothetical protein